MLPTWQKQFFPNTSKATNTALPFARDTVPFVIKTKLVNAILLFFGASIQENEPTLLHIREGHLLGLHPHECDQQGDEIVLPVSKKKKKEKEKKN